MNYAIRELEGFSVIGQEIELTNSTVKNIQIPSSRYLVVEHRGSMSEIYKTYKQIYEEIIPKLVINCFEIIF